MLLVNTDGRCRTNADGLNGVGGGSEAFKESQAGTCCQALNTEIPHL